MLSQTLSYHHHKFALFTALPILISELASFPFPREDRLPYAVITNSTISSTSSQSAGETCRPFFFTLFVPTTWVSCFLSRIAIPAFSNGLELY